MLGDEPSFDVEGHEELVSKVTGTSKQGIGIGSLVLHDIPDDTSVVGRPAVELNKYKQERKALKAFMGLRWKNEPIATRKRILVMVWSMIVNRIRLFFS